MALLPLGLFFTSVGQIIAQRASDVMLGVIVVVWIASCSLSTWFCWSYQTRRSANAITPSPSDSPASGRPLLMMLFCVVLLIITAGFLVLFASGVLRFGLEGPFIFVVYLFAGLVVAVICFGLLSSQAQASGTKYGIAFKLSGPIVALALVAGGGAIYEQRVRPPQALSMRVYFYDEDRRERAPVTGSFCLELPNRSLEQRIDADGGVTFTDLPVSLSGRAVAYSLKSADYQIHPQEKAETILLGAQERILLRVKKRIRTG